MQRQRRRQKNTYWKQGDMKEKSASGRFLRELLAEWETEVSGSSLPAPPKYDGPDIWISHLTEKSSEVTPGACFVARVRATSDGHPYIPQAVNNGASVILAQKPIEKIAAHLPDGIIYLQVPDTSLASAWFAAAWEGFPSRELVVIGITGTDGKTSTANILLEMLLSAGIRTGLLSTTRAVIGIEEEPLALHVTTPEAPVIQRHLRRMVDAGLTHCILETTSHGLSQNRVGAIDFDVAVVTNVTHEHLDYHGDYNSYLSAKARLFEAISGSLWPVASSNPAKQSQLKTAVLNQDDGSYNRLSDIGAARQISFGIYSAADIKADEISYGHSHTDFMMQFGDRLSPEGPAQVSMSSPLIGEFNVYNSLAATGAALAVGAGVDAIREGLKRVDSIDGRMEQIDRGQPFTVIVDFAHTPNALSQAIEAARTMTTGRVITVFGSAGKRDVEKRTRMAQISTRYADLTIFTAEDPRTDSLEEILEVMATGSLGDGGIEGQTFWRVPDRGKAIYFALSLAEPGDLVLICGKGHEQSMCFGVVEYPWDDRQATERALDALANNEPMPDLGLPTFKD
jgi:UDP-N-acetylmuramoyl-L-alanyl-D-glutamate--2,6-diaminopimelate ligase